MSENMMNSDHKASNPRSREGWDRTFGHNKATSIRTLNGYQKSAARTYTCGTELQILYPLIGLVNEAGEVAGKIKKILRGDNGANPTEDAIFGAVGDAGIADELGDVLWYLAMLAADLGFTLEEIAEMNIEKLTSRKERGVIKGSGDMR